MMTNVNTIENQIFSQKKAAMIAGLDICAAVDAHTRQLAMMVFSIPRIVIVIFIGDYMKLYYIHIGN